MLSDPFPHLLYLAVLCQ